MVYGLFAFIGKESQDGASGIKQSKTNDLSMRGTTHVQEVLNYRRILSMNNQGVMGSSHLPSQQPKTKDDYERGYDKGVMLTADAVINLIDGKAAMHEIRRAMVEAKNASK
jgi:hypothetical protein